MKIWPGASIDWCFLSTTVVSQPEARLEFAYRRLVCKKGGSLLGCHVRFIEGRLAIYYDTHTRVLDETLTSVTGEINGPREEACCGSRGGGGYHVRLLKACPRVVAWNLLLSWRKYMLLMLLPACRRIPLT